MSKRNSVVVNRSYYSKFTIPAAPATLRSVFKAGLIAFNSLTAEAAEELLSKCVGFKILGTVEAGTDRAAFTIGNSAALPVELIAAGAPFEPPTINDMNVLFVDGGAGDLTGVGVVLYIN